MSTVSQTTNEANIGLYARATGLAKSTWNKVPGLVKEISIGYLAGTSALYMGKVFSGISRSIGIIPEYPLKEIREYAIDAFNKEGFNPFSSTELHLNVFNKEKLLNASSYHKEVANQINEYFSTDYTEESVKSMTGVLNSENSAIVFFEELLFRGLIQDILLQRIPKFVVSKVAPGRESIFDHKVYTVARIVFTSALFSFMHSPVGNPFYHMICPFNASPLPSFIQREQIVPTFVKGILYGALKESSFGIQGSIIAHMTNNFTPFKIFE